MNAGSICMGFYAALSVMCDWQSPTLSNSEVRLVLLRADQEQMLFSY